MEQLPGPSLLARSQDNQSMPGGEIAIAAHPGQVVAKPAELPLAGLLAPCSNFELFQSSKMENVLSRESHHC